jgi:cytochrome c oxidase subunit 4
MSGHHIVPFSVNLKTFLSLVVLTVLTVYTAKFVDLGHFNIVLAMGIAGLKAFIVLSWFMHLKYDGNMNRAIFLSAFVFLALLVGLSALDLFTR